MIRFSNKPYVILIYAVLALVTLIAFEPVRLEPEGVKDSKKPAQQEDEEAPSPADSYEPPKMTPEKWGTFDTSPPLPQEGSAHTPPLNPPLPKLTRGGTGIRQGRGLIFKGRIPGQLGRTMAGKSHNLRFCPESRELIDKQECESCEKYRRWPEGTNEEPKECWYYRQPEPPGGETDDSDE